MSTFYSKRSRDSVLYNMHGIFMRTSCRLVSLKRSQDMSPPLFLHCYCTRNLSWERSLWSDQEVHRFLPLKPSQSTHLHIIWIFLLFYINLIFFVFIIVTGICTSWFRIQNISTISFAKKALISNPPFPVNEIFRPHSSRLWTHSFIPAIIMQ